MAKIYLLNPPFELNGKIIPKFFRCTRWQGGITRGGTYWYPIWLSYAAGVLEDSGYDIKLVDASAKGWRMKETARDVESFNPDFVVVETNFSSLRHDINLTQRN